MLWKTVDEPFDALCAVTAGMMGARAKRERIKSIEKKEEELVEYIIKEDKRRVRRLRRRI